MKFQYLLLSVAPLALATSAFAEDAAPTAEGQTSQQDNASSAGKQQAFSTGVARKRDLLDMAISASSLEESEIWKLSPRTTTEIFRAIPGIRSDSGSGEGNANITIRGLPMASTGAKFLQLQENGLPVLEFGDITGGGADMFLRADLNLSQIQAIRGGSASTFSSNSPGGVINLIDKTGTTEGGSIQLSSGLDYKEKRIDLDYGGRISDTLRFHIGGFYHQGEGPRRLGYDGNLGGQIKFNITKEFTGGYIRFYGKYLDDRTPLYFPNPIRITGTDANPHYQNIPNFNISGEAFTSRNFSRALTADENNSASIFDMRDGQRAISKSFGVESQFDFHDWSITERFHYSRNSGNFSAPYALLTDTAQNIAANIGGAGATLTYANGPNAGAPYTGNSLLSVVGGSRTDLHALDNITNDIRASRVWNVGGGELTSTVGFYKSQQKVESFYGYNVVVMEARGGGNAALINVTTAANQPATSNGYVSYGVAQYGEYPRLYKLNYDTNAGFGSLNYHIGRIVLGASVRYDFGGASGDVYGKQLGGNRVGSVVRDLDGDGVISPAEQDVAVLPLASPAPVNYNYHYWSYSGGVNYRISDDLAVFGRYSRGARTNSDRLLFANPAAISTTDGHLINRKALIDYVRQAEVGVKYRNGDLSLNLTGFWAGTQEHNSFFGEILDRKYRAVGLEFEGAYQIGPFSITAGATYTDAKIVHDAKNSAIDGNVPRRQPKLFFQTTPQVNFDRFNLGASIYGMTDSYAQDVNLLKMPGYVLVSPFVTYRPADRMLLSLNVSNVFNVTAISYVTLVEGTIAPTNDVVTLAQTANGRTISAAIRFDF